MSSNLVFAGTSMLSEKVPLYAKGEEILCLRPWIRIVTIWSSPGAALWSAFSDLDPKYCGSLAIFPGSEADKLVTGVDIFMNINPLP